MITEVLNRLRYLVRGSRLDAEFEQELRFHLETRAAELQSQGLTAAAALGQARREFGSPARAHEEVRSAWQFRWLEDLASDLRYAGRSFGRNPAFAATAVTCLALGIGVNTTIFSIANEVLFSRPSVRDPQTLAAIRVGGNSAVQMDIYRFFRDARIFDGLIGEHEEGEINWRDGEVTSRLFPMRVTDNFFAVSGMLVAMGRPIQPGETDTVVLSDGLWRGRLDGDPHVVGRTMILDGTVHTIVGVLPRDHRTLFGFGFSPDIYLPVSDEHTYVTLYGRLTPGMTRAGARARLEAACYSLDGPHPDPRHHWARGVAVTAVSGMERIRSDEATAAIAAFFAMLLTVVGLVLLIACANVASLLLARASSREHEFAIRLSIGAGQGRLVRQLLTESLLLAVSGTVAGLALNLVLTSVLSQIRIVLPVTLQYHIRPDERLLAYSAALAMVTCLAAGLLPALRAARSTATSNTLKREEHQVSGRWTMRNVLVIGQLAVSIVLLSASLLFVRNLVQASTSNPGFDLKHTVWAYMRLVPASHTNPEKTRALAGIALENLRALPGVESVALATVVPLNNNMTIGLPVRTDLAPEPVPVTFRFNNVGPGYFHVMQIPILHGREFLPSDRRGAPRIAILNEAMARRLFGSADPIGHIVTWGESSEMIVGIARNSKYFTLGEENMPALYSPYEQADRPGSDLHFLIRAAGAPQLLVAPVNAALGRLDPTAAIETRPMSQALTLALLPSRFGAAILGSVGLLGVALAAIGLYGALLYGVTRRLREIGLRIALGATWQDVLWLVLRQSVTLAATGIAIGIALAVFAVRPLAMFLTPEVRPTNVGTFVAVAAVMLAVTLTATISPALRSLRVDPITSLRYE